MAAYKLIVQNAKLIVKTVANSILNITGIKDLFTATGNVANNKVDWTLQHYTNTAALFTSTNPILLVGQLGIETDNLATNPQYKIGNGTSVWTALPYANTTSNGTVGLDPVISQLNTPSGSPSTGDRHLVNTVPTGLWVGYANNVAEWNGAVWVFTAPVTDYTVYITSTLTTLRYNGSAWVAWAGTAILQDGNAPTTSLRVGTNNTEDFYLIQNNISRFLLGANNTSLVELILNTETADTLTYLNGSKKLKSVTLGTGLTLTSGTLAATSTSQSLQDVITVSPTVSGVVAQSSDTTKYVYISNNGIGINTATPSAKLQVVGGASGVTMLGNILDNLGSWTHVASVDSGNGFLFVQNGGSSNVMADHRVEVQGGAGGSVINIYNGAGVVKAYIKTQAGVNHLVIENDAGTGGIEVQADGTFVAYQNTGIGTTSPSTKLDVIGTIRSSDLTASELTATNASKHIVSLPVATYPSLTELSYGKGVTSAIQTQINLKPICTKTLWHIFFNPADNSVFYYGEFQGNVSTTANLNKFTFLRSGTIKECTISTRSNVGSNEAMSMYIRENNTTDNLLSNNVKFDVVSNSIVITGLSIAVTAGTTYEIKGVAPAWATNPTTVGITVSLNVY